MKVSEDFERDSEGTCDDGLSNSRMERLRTTQAVYPETHAGGFSRVDGTVQFYLRVSALTKPSDVLLDLGAGRGAALKDDVVGFRRQLRNHGTRCKRVIGADVDPVIRSNPSLDEALIIEDDGRIPLPDASVDIIVSDYTLEHIDAPVQFCAEVDRVLKPGGWLCARTPNKWGYISLGANLVPNRLHASVLKRVQPARKEEDVFPTVYRLNSKAQLRRHLPPERWRHCTYYWDSEPAYFGDSPFAWRVVNTILALIPSFFSSTLMIFLQKK